VPLFHAFAHPGHEVGVVDMILPAVQVADARPQGFTNWTVPTVVDADKSSLERFIQTATRR
jgi:hypothetical protein